MAGVTLPAGRVVYSYGQPLTAIHLITKGLVKVSCGNAEFTLGVGDVIGIAEICSEIHFLEYRLLEDSELVTYPVSSMEMLADFVSTHSDLARLFIISSFRQISAMLNQSATNSVNCSNLYSAVREDFATYEALCKKHRHSLTFPDGYSELEAYLAEEAPDYWLYDFYSGLCKTYTGNTSKELLADTGISMGMLRKCSLDLRRTYTALEEQARYVKDLNAFYLNDSGNDFLSCMIQLYAAVNARDEDSDRLFNLINRMILSLFEEDGESDLLKERQDLFYDYVAKLDTEVMLAETAEEARQAIAPDPELSGAMDTILEYSGLEEEFMDSFRETMLRYMKLADKESLDDEPSTIRRRLAKDFIKLYSGVFFSSLKEETMPLPVKLFLYFGFIDEELAGIENASILKNLSENMDSVEGDNVYTFYSWLMAIYEGRKEPSRNEFDTDYGDMIRKLKSEKNLSMSDFMKLESNQIAKVDFELTNFFASTNKMTFGRIGSYFPFFTEENALKDLTASLITKRKADEALEEIRSIDTTAFYRETIDKDPKSVLGKLPVHVECLPDVILMPNMGIRGVMWQEIEGKYRTTPSRMVFSIFHLEDFLTSFIRATGEFRWEMCKRIQGSRWNDITDPSLTGEYFDYVQFYRKSHDLTSEAKEKLKSQLQRCKNSFKEMFVRDYLQWVLYEGKGSPRLNKVARKILFTYCPFPHEVSARLSQNPLYQEAVGRHSKKMLQQLHILKTLAKKLENSGKEVPQILTNEISYYEKIRVE